MATISKTKTRSVQKIRAAKAPPAKPAKKPPPAQKAKASASKPAAAKPRAVPLKPAPAKKTPAAAAAKTAPVKKAAAPAAVAARKTPPGKQRFNKTDLKQFQLDLLAMRDRITDLSGAMKSAALQRSDETNLEEDGTDASMRLQTLEQVGTQQGVITQIDEALHAIRKGTYGICDTCGDLISKARLAVLPFARSCVTCQSETERLIRHARGR